jgi:hypothetical protein
MGIIFALFCATVLVYPITIVFRILLDWKARTTEEKRRWIVIAVLGYISAAVAIYALELGA